MATESKKVITIDTGSAKTSVKDLRNELKDLRDTLVSTEQGTQEYNDAMLRAAEIQHQLRDTMKEVNNSAMDFGQITSNVSKTLTGITAGFQAAKSVMTLFGVESEDIVKSMQRMQSIMALTQALPALDEARKAMSRLSSVISLATGATSAFGKALISTGIGAAVAALGLLIANWDKIKDSITGVNRALVEQEKLNYESRIKRENAELERQEKLLRSINNIRGTSPVETETQILEQYAQALKEAEVELGNLYTKQYSAKALQNAQALAQVNEQITLQQENVAKLRKQYSDQLQVIEDTKKLEEARNAAEAKRKAEEKAKEITEQLRLQEELIKKINVLGGDIEWANSLKDGTKEATENLQRYFDVLLQIKSDISWLENLPAGTGPKLELVVDEEEIEDDFSYIIDNVKQYIEQLRASMITPEELYEQDLQNLKNALQLKLIAEEEYTELKKKLDDEQAEYSKKKQMEVARTVMSSTSQGLNSMANLFSSIASMIDDSTEKGFEQQKNLQVASATMNMLSGVVAAWNSAMALPAPASFILGALQTAATVALGIAQISQIKKQQFNSSSTGSPSTSAITSITAPVQYTQDVQGASIEGAIKDTRVYVLESDIATTTRKVNVAESEARF